MPKQTRQSRGGARNWQFKGINAILNAPQPAAQPRSQEEVEQRVNRAQRDGRDGQAKESARDRGDRRSRGRQESNTSSRSPERGNLQKAQGTTNSPARGLLDRIRRDGKPLVTTEPQLPRYGSPRKWKRGKTAERDLEEPKRHRQSSPNHGTRKAQDERHEQAHSQSNVGMHEHQPINTQNQEEKSLNEDHNSTERHKASTRKTQPPSEIMSAVRKSSETEIGQQKYDRRAHNGQKQNVASHPYICEKAISKPAITDKSKEAISRPPMVKKDIEHVPNTLPSPPLSKSSSPDTKRKSDDIEKVPSEDACKRQRVNGSRLPTPGQTNQEDQKPHLRKKPEPQKPGRKPRAESAFASAPTAANHECQHTYRPYNHDSVPILYSTQIRHSGCPDLLNNPSPQLKVDAMLLLERGFKSKDLGREDISKEERGRTKFIKDVDLYLMNDGKIYVATERGLVLAADYIKLAGIPDTTPVRFNGVKPTWVTASIARRYVRLTTTATWKKSKKTGDDCCCPNNSCTCRVYPEVPEGDLALLAENCVVEVWERDPKRKPRNYEGSEHSGRAFGRRLDRLKDVGWFDWHHVGDFETISTPWEGVFTAQNIALVSAAHAPPVSSGGMSVAAMNRALSTLFPTPSTGWPVRRLGPRISATPPASARAASTPARATPPALRKISAPTTGLVQTMPVTRAPERPKTGTPIPKKATQVVDEQPQASAMFEPVPTAGEEPAAVDQPVIETEEQPSIDAQAPKVQDQPANTPELEQAQTSNAIQPEEEPAEYGAKTEAKTEASVFAQKGVANEVTTTEPQADASMEEAATVVAPTTVPPPVRCALYRKDVEDEVDWDDDEL
jgi:hypothetical protein